MCIWISSRHLSWRARISPNLVIIVAACARPYVMAAVGAGYQVAAFDIFNDVETRRFCWRSEAVPFHDGGFDADSLLSRLNVLNAQHVVGLAYGSGLEKQPALLKEISTRFELLGNAPEVVARLKNYTQFFDLLDALGIAHPEICNHLPLDANGWLVKNTGGAGGTHIRRHAEKLETGDYCQWEVQGQSLSALFLADGDRAQVVGYNEQWLAPSADMPFRYGGAVSQVDLPDAVKCSMASAVQAITKETGLRGINSMDFMLTEQGLLALEVNPRLSATFDLYAISDLFERHIQACRGVLKPLPLTKMAKAHGIVYAPRALQIAEQTDWPEWVVDRPWAGQRFQQDAPVCTVLATAENAVSAKQLAFARAHRIDAQFDF